MVCKSGVQVCFAISRLRFKIRCVLRFGEQSVPWRVLVRATTEPVIDLNFSLWLGAKVPWVERLVEVQVM